MGPAEQRVRRGEGLVAFALAFAWLSIGASPAHFWLDSGELSAAGHELGVVHPPGTPGLVLLLRMSAWLPLGGVGFRMALVDCALGAATVVLVGLVLARHGASRPLRWGAGAWVLAGLTFGRQCRVVEVYALATALMMVALWGFDPAIERARRTGPRLLGTFAAVWAAWSFGDLRLALAPPVIIAWWLDLRRGRAWARWAPLVVVTASAMLVSLPLASITGPWMDWGDPQTAGRLWSHLQAESIREGFADEILPASGAMWRLNAGDAVARLAEDLGAPGLVLAMAALVLQAWTRPWRGSAEARSRRTDRAIALGLFWVVAVEAFYIVGINPMGGADRQTGIVLAPIAALVVGRVLAAWLSGRPRLAWAILPLTGAVTIGPALLGSFGDLAITRSWGPPAWTRGALAQLPPGSLLLTQSDDLSAGLAYASVVEGARPDLVFAPAQHLHKAAPEVDPRRRAPWDAAASASTEHERIEAAIAGHVGVVALEHPAQGVMARVRFWSDRGAVPLAIGASSGEPTAIPIRPDAVESIEHWIPRLPTQLDRRRLAIALAQQARGRVKVEGDAAGAMRILELVVQQVTDAYPSALVTLAALRDRFGDTPAAIVLTRRALELEPGRSVALTNLALYLSRDPSTRAEALVLAERAAALRPWRRDVWERLAEVRMANGDAQGAQDARERAKSLLR